MNLNEFWTIIEASTSPTQAEQYEKLKTELSKLDRDALIDFDRHYRSNLNLAFHWNLWAAAYIINGGCSDDAFDYFCDWLISRGQTVFENALNDPKSLGSIATPNETDFEEFRYVMGEVFEEKFGEELPRDSSTQRPMEPAGDEWDEDTVEQKYPGLAASAEAAFAAKAAERAARPNPANAAIKKQGKRILRRVVLFGSVFLIFYLVNRFKG